MTGKAEPWVCPTCRDEPEGYYGRLVFPEERPPSADRFEAVAENGGSIVIPEPPTCPSPAHRKEDGTIEVVLLVPVALTAAFPGLHVSRSVLGR